MLRVRREHHLAPGAVAPLGRRVDRDGVSASLVGDYARLGVDQAEAAAELAAQRDQPPVELEQRAGIAALGPTFRSAGSIGGSQGCRS